MQIDMDSDIVYFNDDKNSLYYYKYKAGDYIPDDELFGLFSKVYGKIHSTGGNFYQLEESEDKINKNNERYIITNSKGIEQICLILKPHFYTYIPNEPLRFQEQK
jgi:hypothetical protein